MPTLEEFFDRHPESRLLFDALTALIGEPGPSEMRVMKSQIVFRREKDFAWVWAPGQYRQSRKNAPLVLTLSFPQPDPSPRWKEVVQPSQKRFIHHLEILSLNDLDEEVRAWLQSAYENAK